MEKLWNPIPKFELYYSVNKSGDVYSHRYKRILHPIKQKHGYLRVRLYNSKEYKWYLVHRLIALTFIPNPENKKTVNHKDGNPSNNHISNLEWMTQRQQMLHAYKTGLRKKSLGSNHPNSKFNEKDIVKIKEMCFNGVSQRKVAAIYNVHYSTINHIIKKRTWVEVMTNHTCYD
jgi:hypothetical protein